MESKNTQNFDMLKIIMKKRMINRANKSRKENKRIINSTTSISNILYPSLPSTTNISYNNKEQIKNLEEYSKYHFNNFDKNEKTELTLLKNSIDSFINKNKLSPKVFNSLDNKHNIRNRRIYLKYFTDSKKEKETIWDKLNKSKCMKESYKYARSNIKEKITKYELLEKQRDINNLIKTTNIKSNHYNEIKKLYKNEIKILEENKKNIKRSYDYLNNLYNKNNESASNIIFTTAININNGNNELMLDKRQLKKDIIKLENNINKLKIKKNEILNWIYLLIQIKENKDNLPDYYLDIIDKNISYDVLIKKEANTLLKKEEYERIKSYKNNLVYNIDEFFLKLIDMDKKLMLILKDETYIKSYRNKIENMNKRIKLEQINKERESKDDEINLKKEISILKNRLKNTYNDKNNYNNLTKKKYFNKLFPHILKLFEEFKKLKFSKIDIKINFFDGEEKIIKDIIEYFEVNFDFLLNERRYYKSKRELRERYKEAEEVFKKEKKYLTFINKHKLIAKLIEEKKEKIQRRLDNQNYRPIKKIDFEYYLRQKYKTNKSCKQEENLDDVNSQLIIYS